MKAIRFDLFQTMLAWLLLTGGLSVASAKDLVEDVHKTMPLKEDGKVRLDNVNGSIKVVTWDRAEVQLDAVKRAGTQQDLDNLKIEIDAQPARLTVHTKYPKRATWRWRSPSASVEYKLQIPAGASLESLESINGGVEITGVRGPIRASSVNGAVTVKDAQADCRLETVNGRIEAAFTRLQNAKSVSLKAVNGKVDLTLPAAADVQVDASTVNGSISGTSDLRPVRNWPVGSHLNGQLGSGTTKVKIETVNGSIRLQQPKDTGSAQKQG